MCSRQLCNGFLCLCTLVYVDSVPRRVRIVNGTHCRARASSHCSRGTNTTTWRIQQVPYHLYGTIVCQLTMHICDWSAPRLARAPTGSLLLRARSEGEGGPTVSRAGRPAHRGPGYRSEGLEKKHPSPTPPTTPALGFTPRAGRRSRQRTRAAAAPAASAAAASLYNVGSCRRGSGRE